MTLLEHTATGLDLAPLNDLISQQFWTGTSYHLPEVYEVDCSDFEMNDSDLRPDSELALRMRDTFDSVGLVVLRNTRLTSVASMRKFAQILVDAEMVYEGGGQPKGPY